MLFKFQKCTQVNGDGVFKCLILAIQFLHENVLLFSNPITYYTDFVLSE